MGNFKSSEKKVGFMRAFALGVVFFCVLQIGNTAPAFHFPLILEALCLICAAIMLWQTDSGLLRKPLHKTLRMVLLGLGSLAALQVLRSAWAFLSLFETPVCRLMPGAVQKLECILQMEAAANPGIRQLTYSLAAAGLFAATSLGSVLQASTLRRFLGGGLLISTLMAGITLLRYYGLVDWVLPQWFFINEFGPACLFIQNPSWIWPWCTPWICYALWQVLSEDRQQNWLRFYSLVCALLLILFSISSSQRGAVLQVLVAGGAGLLALVFWGSWKNHVSTRTYFILGTVGFLLAASAISAFFFKPEFINQLLSGIGIHTRVGGGESSLSKERLEMWHIAWQGVQDAFWLGHGQGSWTREFGKIAQAAGQPGLIFDTAHNFFVQSLFELGALHTLLIVGFFVFVLFRIGKGIFQKEGAGKKSWYWAVCAAYAVILAVQEVDFVRSSHYQHAIFWGFLFGQSTAVASAAEEKAEHTLELKTESWKFRAFRLGTGLVLISAVGLTALSLFGFSLAGYQYEANARNGYNPKVRWLGSFGTLNYVLPRADEKNPVARFRVLKSFATEYAVLSAQGWKQVPIANPEAGASFIDIPVSSGFQLPSVIKFNNAQNDYGRHISVLVAWPPEIIEGQP